MNRIYRLVFNHALGQIQVTSEIGASPSGTTGATRRLPARLRLLPLALALAYAGGAQAVELPQNGIASGATISSAGNTMTITQAQAKALITWGSFNIGEGGAVNITTPDANGVTLNMVNGGTLSSIDGVLKSNGHVFLINPAGIAFGGTAQVNVAGLVASSLTSNTDGQSDDYQFVQDGAAAVVSTAAGAQITSGGPVMLMGASVSNSGSIVGSTVNLLSAGGVTLHYDPLAGLTAQLEAATSSLPAATSAAVSNTGSITANQIILRANLDPALAASAINLGGAVQATQLLSADVVGGGLNISGDVTAGTIRLAGDKGVNQSDGKVVASTGLELAVTGDATLSREANKVSSIGGTVSGNLALSNAADLTQTGALEVTGSTTLTSALNNVTLTNAGNSFGGNVSLRAKQIEISASGRLAFGNVEVSSLAVTAGSIHLPGVISSAGAQAYNGAVVLDQSASLSSALGAITFNGVIDGAHALWATAAGEVIFGGAVGGSTALASLDVSGAARISLASNVTTTGTQRYTGPVNLLGTTWLTSREAGAIDFSSTINGGHGLIVSTAGATTFAGAIGGTGALASLTTDAAGTTELGGNVTTSGAQQYNASVVLTKDATLTSTDGGDIGFGSTLDGDFALQVNTAGVTRFGGAVGGVGALVSLTTDAAGTTELGGGVATSGDLAFNDAVNLKAFTSVRSQSGTTTFGSTVVGPWDLVATGSAGSAFGGAVDVRSLQVQGGGTTTLGGDVSVDTSAMFSRPVSLTNDVTLDVGTVSFAGAINGAHALDITATGAVIIGDHVGAITALDSLTVRAASLNANGITTTGNLSVDVAAAIRQAAAYSIGGAASFASQGDITLTNFGNRFAGVVSLDGGTVQIASAAALDLDVVQAGSLSATTAGGLRLGNATIAGNSLLSGNGIVFDDVTIQGNLGAVSVGSIQQSGALNVAGTSQLNAVGDITLSNGQNAFGGALALSGRTIDIESASHLLVTQLHNGANAAVSLVSAKGLSLTGNDVDTGTANLTLAANDGQLITQVALAGAGLDLLGSHGIVLSGNVSAAGAGTFTSTNSDIVQNSGRTRVDGVTTISAGTGRIGFGNSSNLFTGPVYLSGGATTIRSTGFLRLDGSAVRSLDATGSAGLDIADMSVAENAALDAGSGALTVNSVDVGGNLTANGASITQTGALVVDGAATLQSTGSISVSDAVLGSLDVTAGNALTISNSIAGNTTLRSANGIVFADVAIRGDLGAASGSSILQSARLDVTGSSQLNAIGNIKLDNGQNAFGGSVSVRAANASIISSTALLLGKSEVGYLGARTTGDLRLTGQITADSVDLSTDGVFDNRYGANAIQLNGNGRWNIYLKSPTSPHNFGNLDSANSAIWNTAAFAGTTASGNRYLFAWQPTLTVQASSLRKIYGDTLRLDNAYTVSGGMTGVAGAYNADVIADLIRGTPVLSSSGAAGTAVVSGSPYQIDINQGSLNTGISGYALTFVGGQLSIDPRTLTITANSVGKTYGQIGNFNGFSSDALINGDSLSSVDLASSGMGATANVGNYAITASNAIGTGLSNYDIHYVDGSLSIGKAGLVITANDASRRAGELLTLDGYRASGLLNGDSIDSVSLSSAGNNANAGPGVYAILVGDAQGARLGNYDISYQDGSLQVTGLSAAVGAEIARAVVASRNDAAPVSLPNHLPPLLPAPSSSGTSILLPEDSCTQARGMGCLTLQPE